MTDERAEESRSHEVRIHIDGEPHDSPNPTTDDALYALGKVPPELELFRETEGNQEDVPVPRGSHEIHLRKDEHFYAGLEWTIIVEGSPHPWPKRKITYSQVVTLFDPEFPHHPEMTYRVMWEHGPAHKPDGILVLGASVKIRNEMVFHVSPTGQS